MRLKKFKSFVLLFGLLLPTAWCGANDLYEKEMDEFSVILVKEARVENPPKGSTINASLNGHNLTVAFKENLGEVAIEITTATGNTVESFWLFTPNGLQTYLPLAGDYVITFTLPNGDEYYGEFTVTD